MVLKKLIICIITIITILSLKGICIANKSSKIHKKEIIVNKFNDCDNMNKRLPALENLVGNNLCLIVNTNNEVMMLRERVNKLYLLAKDLLSIMDDKLSQDCKLNKNFISIMVVTSIFNILCLLLIFILYIKYRKICIQIK